jgi:hypothetical protein
MAKIAWPERPDSSGSGRIPASGPDSDNFGPNPASGPGVRPFCAKFRATGHFRRNPTNIDSKETVRIPAFNLDSGYSSRIKVAGILLVSDGISSPVIFILIYINIYMF